MAFVIWSQKPDPKDDKKSFLWEKWHILYSTTYVNYFSRKFEEECTTNIPPSKMPHNSGLDIFYYVVQIPILREISGLLLLAAAPNIWREQIPSPNFFFLKDSRPVEQKIDGSWADYICNTVLASVRGLEGSWRSSSPPQKSERTNGLQGTRCFNKSCSSAVWYWQCDQTGVQVRNLT